MSFQFSANQLMDVADAKTKVEALAADTVAAYDGDAPDETKAQIDAAVAAIGAIIESGSCGKTGPWQINAYGNANPKHEDRVGYAGDGFTVSVLRG